jgi:hypothetical protein
MQRPVGALSDGRARSLGFRQNDFAKIQKIQKFKIAIWTKEKVRISHKLSIRSTE